MNDVYKKLFSLDNILNEPSETNNFLNTIQNAIAIGSWEVNLKSMELYWSPMTKQIHEVEPDYIPSLDNAFDFYPNLKDRELLQNVFNNAFTDGEKYDIELQLKTAKKNNKWVRAIGYPVFKDGICIKIMGVFQDVTSKTNILNETALKEKQISTILDNSPNGMAVVDLNGNLIS